MKFKVGDVIASSIFDLQSARQWKITSIGDSCYYVESVKQPLVKTYMDISSERMFETIEILTSPLYKVMTEK